MVNNKLKWNDQVNKAAQTANGVLASLKSTFNHQTTTNFKKLYTAFVRPHLEYCTAAWNPSQKKDIKILEKVQRRATKLVPHLRNLSYVARLAAIGIPSLEDRRTRGDIIQMNKIEKGLSVVRLHALTGVAPTPDPELSSSNLRRSKLRLIRQFCTSKSREQFLTNRVASLWNEIPEATLNSISVNAFKDKFDKFSLQQKNRNNTTIAEQRLAILLHLITNQIVVSNSFHFNISKNHHN